MSIEDQEEGFRVDIALEVEDKDSLIAIDFLVDNVNLSKSRIKDVMNKGAVWLKRGKGTRSRIRRAMTDLKIGDVVELYYDEDLLALKPPPAKLIEDNDQYSVWFKPSGMLTQGNDWGDHTSLLRFVELQFNPRREVFLVHQLEREAAGLVIIVHTKRCASDFSRMFQNGDVKMKYRCEVLGDTGEQGIRNRIEEPLDEKETVTEYELIKFEPHTNVSKVDCWIASGRKHQIRRHFELINHPVMGDPKYGKGNKNRDGMKLSANLMEFICPISNELKTVSLYD